MTEDAQVAGSIYATREWPPREITACLSKLGSITHNGDQLYLPTIWTLHDLAPSPVSVKEASHINLPVQLDVRRLLGDGPHMRLLLYMTPPLNSRVLVKLARALSAYEPVVLDDMFNRVRLFPEQGNDDRFNSEGPPMDLDTALGAMFHQQFPDHDEMERWPPAAEADPIAREHARQQAWIKPIHDDYAIAEADLASGALSLEDFEHWKADVHAQADRARQRMSTGDRTTEPYLLYQVWRKSNPGRS